jgi:hypothetical protein
MITVKDPGKIPGQIKNLDGGAGDRFGYLEDAVVYPDGNVVVDPAFSLHTKQVLDIGDLGQFAACVLP